MVTFSVNTNADRSVASRSQGPGNLRRPQGGWCGFDLGTQRPCHVRVARESGQSHYTPGFTSCEENRGPWGHFLDTSLIPAKC